MSSVIILKKISNYSPKQTLENFKKASHRANMYCFHITVELDPDNNVQSAEGTLSEVDEETLLNTGDEDTVRYFTFNINNVVEISYDSFTWLTESTDYFWALDIVNINHEYEFIYRFVVEYFKDNPQDYLWFDDAEWCYTAEDILQLSQRAYNPNWCSEKVI
ncbi:hypothetical protein [Paenibacillus silvae]|uniref:hypothetical protein n=1 Tax=Paenibacillus silvae TaxID=1325358 RepID=UPI0011A8B0B7|nr:MULTISPECIES: hypothetical protein [Paenibacillus]MCK6077942.1 hypothetical protein [Paenibacillus silvae]MCK6152141.1 hypothetical protein [Paenibacillus silvae]MCK6270826.1 hypothetical protein [Paenibacillus silvae]